MSLANNTEITCLSCGAAGQARIYGSINVGTDPELKDRVRSGELFLWKCPHCSATRLLKYSTLYHDPQERMMVWLTDGDPLAEERAGELFENSGELEGYTGRIVNDVGSLIEKVNLFDAGLDDVAVEMCKYVVRQERGEDLKLKFLRLDGAESEIVFGYPGQDRMELLSVGLNVYEDCRAILSRNPAVSKLSGGLARIDAAWLEEFIR